MYNNVAIAAQMAVAEKRAKKVLIVDWDVHHGKRNSIKKDMKIRNLMVNNDIFR